MANVVSNQMKVAQAVSILKKFRSTANLDLAAGEVLRSLSADQELLVLEVSRFSPAALRALKEL